MLADIARLMAMRMAYEDPIRIAQMKLAELDEASGGLPMKSVDDVRKFRLDEMVGALPAAVAGPVLNALGRIGWLRKRVPMRFSTRSRWGIRRLKIEAALRRWRLFSVRYATERVWVERWLHMIDRALTRQPLAAPSVIETATMIQGYGDPYRQGMADWHAIVDGLVKPTFDGVLALPDLAGAITETRAAALPDPRQAALKRKIAEIRARLPAGATRGGRRRLSAVRGLDDHHLVVVRSAAFRGVPDSFLGGVLCGVPLQVIAAHADLVAHEFIAQLEGIEAVARDRAVAQAYHRAAQDRFELVLQCIELVDRLGMLHPLADIENGGRQFTGLLRRDPGDLGVDRRQRSNR